MKYRNASDILPDKLLKELQKYVSGEAVYIPSTEKRKEWGQGSGARQYYKERNEEIKQKYLRKTDIETLADEYCLSVETIKKILYK